MKSYQELQAQIEKLPKGYLSLKHVYGKERYYLQYREGKKIISKYVKEKDLPEIKKQLEERKKLEAELKEILQDAPLLASLSSSALSFSGDVMSKDEVVASFRNGVLSYLDEKRAPLLLIRTKDLRSWLESRAIDAHRTNSRLLKKALRLKESDDALMVLKVHACTITDDYWFRPLRSKNKYEDVRFHNDMYSLVSLKGDVFSVPKIPKSTPELTNRGSFEKCWKIINDHWWMIKPGTEMELFSEWFCAQLAKALNIPTVEYFIDGTMILCQNFADGYNLESISSLAGDNDDYDHVFSLLLPLGDEICKQYLTLMWFDAIVFNVDRHTENMGLLREPKTGRILSLAPNFDNNLALFARGYPRDVSRTNDGMIKGFLSFLHKNAQAALLMKQITLPVISRELLEEILANNTIEIDKDLVINFILNGYQLIRERLSL